MTQESWYAIKQKKSALFNYCKNSPTHEKKAELISNINANENNRESFLKLW